MTKEYLGESRPCLVPAAMFPTQADQYESVVISQCHNQRVQTFVATVALSLDTTPLDTPDHQSA